MTSHKGSLQRRIAAGEADPISDRERERAQLQEIRQTYIRRFGVDPEAQTVSKTA
ncbi:hypothetical protein [Microbacterium proteolyticum]|uniref:hypothetical protein n=1 Tax=Microbacterium proteolyticum TaxID=1572644 RepID=UPI001612E299|nr:hypothetical protein [Microbacterium proteolyticum]